MSDIKHLKRRDVVFGLAGAALTPVLLGRSGAAFAADKIKPTASSALIVIDVQNCFLPGGSLAVKDGEQVVPVINRLAKGFANVVMTQDWHTAGHVSFASSPSRQEAVRDRRAGLWRPGAVAGSLRPGDRRRRAVEGPCRSRRPS